MMIPCPGSNDPFVVLFFQPFISNLNMRFAFILIERCSLLELSDIMKECCESNLVFLINAIHDDPH